MIEQLEGSISLIEAELLLPEVYSDHQLAQQKSQELDDIKQTLNHSLDEWEKLQNELEEQSL